MKMGKQNKSRKQENVGQGNVTPVQIAFIVDRYLSDNNYTQTRSAFHSEAYSLISKFSVKEAPKSVLSLGAILDDYISLKGQRVFLDQERLRLEQENLRIQNLLKGMHDTMSAYNASANAPSSLPTSAATVPRIDINVGSTPGYYPVYNTPIVISSSRPSTAQTDSANLSTPVINQASSKRRGSRDGSDAPSIVKRSRRSSDVKQLPPKAGIQDSIRKNSAVQQSLGHDNALIRYPVQGSGVAKCLFNQVTQSPPTNSSPPKTPPRASSSQTDKSVSPVEVCSTVTSGKDITPQQITSTNSTIISSRMICISPAKQIAYCSIERNHSISMSSPAKTSLTRPSQRDHVKGRLNFDASDVPTSLEKQGTDGIATSESDRKGEIFDLDLPNLDALGMDFNLSELLLDFDFHNDGIGYSGQQAADSSPDTHSESPHTSENFNTGADQVVSHCSTVTSLSEKDIDMPGPETVTTIKSITKCIKILSPAKSQRLMHQETSSAVGKC